MFMEKLYKGLKHGERTLSKTFKATNSDGHDAMIYVTAYPAMFYEIEWENKTGKHILSTGSSMEELANQIGEAIADGMLDID